MKAYQFLSTITNEGQLIIPKQHIKNILPHQSVQVIVLVDEEISFADISQTDVTDPLSLESVITEIQNTPQNPANIQPASGLLATHLANSPQEANPTFDVDVWNEEWDRVEAKMEQLELAEEQIENNFDLS